MPYFQAQFYDWNISKFDIDTGISTDTGNLGSTDTLTKQILYELTQNFWQKINILLTKTKLFGQDFSVNQLIQNLSHGNIGRDDDFFVYPA